MAPARQLMSAPLKFLVHMRVVAGARVSTAQGEQRRWQWQTMPGGKATGGVDFDPRSGQVRGRVRKVRYFSGMAGARC